MKSRWLFLLFSVGAIAGSLPSQLAGQPLSLKAEAGSRPNVLFLAIDDLNDWIGAAGGIRKRRRPTWIA